MTDLIEDLFANLWNRFASPARPPHQSGAVLGRAVRDGVLLQIPVIWPESKRAEHLAILGKTGSGKSSLLRLLVAQDVREGRGFVFFDLHGDVMGYVLRVVAANEQRLRTDLSRKLIIIEPADPACSIGLNVLDASGGQQGFVQIAEFSSILKQRWGLDNFGARTEELLRNSLLVLVENGLTLVELAPLLTNAAFRATCFERVGDASVREYFEARYNAASDAMQATLREPVLNKLTAFTADPAFRHIIGQRVSTFSLRAALDSGCWIIVNLDKGRLGEQAATLGALLLARIKHALFSRNTRALFSIYADEMQNLVEFGGGMETLFAESRKSAASVVSANQYLDQYPPSMRSAVLSVASHILFQLSSADADKMAAALDGGKSLSEMLKNLPPRHFVAKIGHCRWQRGVVSTVADSRTDTTDLYRRCRERWTRRRADIESDIRARRWQPEAAEGALHDWT
jgi:hypothetical protein